MTLRTSGLGRTLIKTFEGRRLKSYLCPAKVWTIGYGHTSAAGGPPVGPGMTWTAAQAEKVFDEDIDRFEDDVERALGAASDDLTEYQFDALVSLAFNIGMGAFRKSTVLRRVKANNFEGVPAAIMMWNKVKGETVAGLTRRRRAEAALWRGDLDEAEKYMGAKFPSMPHKVDVPKPPKTMAASKTGNAAATAGAVGGGTLVESAIEHAEKVGDLAQQTEGWVPFLERLASQPSFWIGLAVIALCAFIWWDRRRKLYEEHV